MNVYDVMEQKGIVLPQAPAKGGLYSPCVISGGIAWISGCGCQLDGDAPAGRLGSDYSIEQGQEFARRCALNILAVLQREIGDLNRVKRVVKMLAFVASADDFYSQPQVANGASALLSEIFGPEIGLPARSAIGVNALPNNLPVEIECAFEIE